MNPKNSKGAMEMSVGTIVTIVLLMTVLVLGLFFVQKIFSSGNNAIDSVDTQLTSQINQLFSDGSARIAVYPTSRSITITRGDSTPKGFAFSVYNDAKGQSSSFSYVVNASDVSNCKDATTNQNIMTTQIANSFLLGGQGQFTLGPGGSLDLARLVKLDVPTTAPPCTVSYTINLNRDNSAYSSADVFVTFK